MEYRLRAELPVVKGSVFTNNASGWAVTVNSFHKLKICRTSVVLLIAGVVLASCSSSKEKAANPRHENGITEELLEKVALALEVKGSSEPKDQWGIGGLHIFPSATVTDPPYYDVILSVRERKVARHYLNFSGEVSSTNTMTLPESRFWEPIYLLASYYSRHKSFPVGGAYLDILRKSQGEDAEAKQGE